METPANPVLKKRINIIIGITVILILISLIYQTIKWYDKKFNQKTKEVATVIVRNYPDNWPSDIPKIDNGTIQYFGTSTPGTGKTITTLILTTQGIAKEIGIFYQTQLTSAGWKIEQTAYVGKASMISASKGTRKVGVYITENNSGQAGVTIGIEN